jgi:vacuolar-type H+-ATPase subunit I/STV1
MEPVSFTVGVVGLVGTFTACINCFDLVRVGRNFGSDYETSVIKLDLIRLRLTRWAEAIGIAQEDEAAALAQLKDRLENPDRDVEIVERSLGQILHLFERSAETSKRLALRSSNDKAASIESGNFENSTMQNLHKSMRNLALQRQKRSTILQKISWTFHRKRDLRDLIEDLSELVSQLVELAPTKAQKELGNAELATIGTDQNIAILDDALRDGVGDEHRELDSILQACVTDVIQQRTGTMSEAIWKRSKAGNYSTIRQGDHVASDYQGEVWERTSQYVVEDSELGNNVVFHQGNSYGGSA